MKHLNSTTLAIGPLMTALVFFPVNRVILSILSIAIVFLCISKCNACYRRENLFLFVLTPIVTIPMNAHVMGYICSDMNFFWGKILFLKFLILPLAYFMILSVEEIVIGIMGRVIWHHKQYEFWR